jgi:HK97 family phage major capsid protein
MLTVEEILAALQAVMDEAKADDGTSQPMNEDQVERYEKLEAQLATARRSEEAARRHASYTATATSPVIPGHTSTKDGEEQLNRAFNHYLRTGRDNQDIVELRAQGEGVASEGGYLVPAGFRNKIVERMKAFGGIAADVETVTTGTGEPLPWPTLDDTSNIGEIVKEGNTFTSGADLVFGEASLGAYEYMAGGSGGSPLRVSTILLNDAAFDVEGLVSRALGERIARIQAPHLVRGTGAGEPLGLTYGLTGVQIAANTKITYVDLTHFIHSVDPAYRETGCQWGFNDKSLEYLKTIKDDNNNFVFRPDTADMATEAGGGTLMGYRVRIDQSFPDISLASATVNWGVFGNLKEGYVRRIIKDVQLLVNPYARMSNRQVEFSAWARMDATQQNTSAYSALTGKA